MSDLARHWRLREQRYRLEGRRCEGCQRVTFPPPEVCPDCGSTELKPHHLSGAGEVYSFSIVYQAPHGFEEHVPYVVALIRLAEGPLVTAQLTDVDPERVEIGLPVEMVTRRLTDYGEEGLLVYGYKFRPRLAGSD